MIIASAEGEMIAAKISFISRSDFDEFNEFYTPD